MLTEGMQLKKVAFLDTVFEGTKADDGGFLAPMWRLPRVSWSSLSPT